MTKNRFSLNTRFIAPAYHSNCFANIPLTVKYLLTGKESPALPPEAFGGLLRKYDRVIFLLADAFGWNFFEKFGDSYPFLKHLSRNGAVSRLTSQFPSTTASHITTIHSGLPVGQSGIYEWQYYEPQLDILITPLLFSQAGVKKRETLKKAGVDPRRIYPNRTFYQDLQENQIASYVFQHQAYTPSSFGDVMFQGAKVISYKTFPEVMVNLFQLFRQSKTGSYFFLYFDRIDDIGHEYGPDSPQVEAEIDIFLTTMDRMLPKKLDEGFKKTLFIMTADHGLVRVDPKKTIYLNLFRDFTGFNRMIKTNRKDQLIIPGGSCRDMFLYIREEYLEEARQMLGDGLAGKAEVYLVQDLIDNELFGPLPLSPTLLSRLGNLVILPFENESVWWYEKGRFEMTFYGHHGGLTRPEMEIPFMLYAYNS